MPPHPHHCPHCHRSYQRKMYFDRHVAVCEMLCKSKKDRAAEVEEQSDIPTVQDLYKVVMAMTIKYNQLEQKMQEMSHSININVKKQAINGVDQLNATYTKAIDYDHWCTTLIVQRKHLDTLFKCDYAKGVSQVLREHLEDETRPLRTIKEKENVIYMFKETKWVIMDDETYIKLMYLLDKKMMGEFGKWRDENKDNLYADDFTEMYAKNVKKMMVTREPMYSRIKKEL